MQKFLRILIRAPERSAIAPRSLTRLSPIVTLSPNLRIFFNINVSRKFHTSSPLLMAKGKGKKGKGGKDKGGKRKKEQDMGKFEDDEEDDKIMEYVSLPDPEKEYGSKMEKRLSRLTEEFTKIRGGAISAEMFNHLIVKAHGANLSILEVAQITMKTSTKFNVNAYDPELVGATAASIRDSGMGLNPSIEGSNLVVSVNKPSKEQREKVIKAVSQVAEKAKADIRDIRRAGMDKLKKMEKRKEAGKDDAFRLMKVLESLAEKNLNKAAKLFKDKEEEIMSH